MAVVSDNQYTAADGTVGSAVTPAVGSALTVSFQPGAEATVLTNRLRGPTGAQCRYDIGINVTDHTTILTFTNPSAGSGEVEWYFHAPLAAAPWNQNGLTLKFGITGFNTVDLINRNGGGTLASATTGVAANAETTAHYRTDGQRFRLWLGTNTGTPDIDFPTTGYTAGYSGFKIDGDGSYLNRHVIDDVASSPVAPPRSDFQDPRRILARMTRSRLFKAA